MVFLLIGNTMTKRLKIQTFTLNLTLVVLSYNLLLFLVQLMRTFSIIKNLIP